MRSVADKMANFSSSLILLPFCLTRCFIWGIVLGDDAVVWNVGTEVCSLGAGAFVVEEMKSFSSGVGGVECGGGNGAGCFEGRRAEKIPKDHRGAKSRDGLNTLARL